MQKSNVVKYQEHLSEIGPISVIKEKVAEHKNVMIQAPTGCGKTFTLIKLAKAREGKTVFLVPNVSNVMQIAEEYGIPGVYGDETKEYTFEKSNVIVATYDKASLFLKGNIYKLMVVLDEAHNLQSQASFRSDAIMAVKKLARKSEEVIYLSATINHLDHKQYGKVLRFEPETPKTIIGDSKIITSGKNSNKNVALDLIFKKTGEGKKCLVKMNSKNTLQFFHESLEKGKITSTILTSDNKEKSNVMHNILTTKNLPSEYQVVLCTSILDAGINLTEVDVIIDIGNGDPNSIKQFSARPRVSLKEHYIVIKGDTKDRNPEERYTRENVEEVLVNRLRTANSIKDDIEKCIGEMKDETMKYLRFKFSLFEDSLDKEFYIKLDNDQKFYIDIEALRNSEFENYYNSLQTNPELLQKELAEYGLVTVIEEYSLNSGGRNASGSNMIEEDEGKELSMQLKTLQALSTQNFALKCYQSKDPEKYFASGKFTEGVMVPFSMFETFGMYISLGFQYRLTYELLMKTYKSKQKRKKIKNYILAYVYSRMKDDEAVLKDKGYKAFKILYDLYEGGATVEDEEKACIEYGKLFGKKYTSNHITNRGKEMFVLKSKSTKKEGKTIHHKESHGLHTAKSILENFNIMNEKYIDELQELLDNKREKKLVDLYVDKVCAPNAPENDIDCLLNGKVREYFNQDTKCWMDNTETGGIGKPVQSPYFPEESLAEEFKQDNVEVMESNLEEIEPDEIKDEVTEPVKKRVFGEGHVVSNRREIKRVVPAEVEETSQLSE